MGILLVCIVFCIFMLADLNRMEYEMKQDAIRQDVLFKAMDDYIAKLKRDQKEFADKARKHDLEE